MGLNFFGLHENHQLLLMYFWVIPYVALSKKQESCLAMVVLVGNEPNVDILTHNDN